jgi:hypothetical protein
MKRPNVTFLLWGMVLSSMAIGRAASFGEDGLGQINTFAALSDTVIISNTEEDDAIGETKDDDVGNIETGDILELKKRNEALHLATFGFGPAWFTQLDTDPQNYDFYAGYLYEPHPHAAVKTILNITSDFSRSVAVLGEIGANFYVFKSAFSPYVGGAFGIGYVHAEGSDNAGFAGSGSVGLMLFRTSNVHLNLEFKTSVFTQINNRNPKLFALRVGISR